MYYLLNKYLFQAQVQRIHISGVGRTKEDIIINSVKDVFDASHFQAVSTFQMCSQVILITVFSEKFLFVFKPPCTTYMLWYDIL